MAPGEHIGNRPRPANLIETWLCAGRRLPERRVTARGTLIDIADTTRWGALGWLEHLGAGLLMSGLRPATWIRSPVARTKGVVLDLPSQAS